MAKEDTFTRSELDKIFLPIGKVGRAPKSRSKPAVRPKRVQRSPLESIGTGALLRALGGRLLKWVRRHGGDLHMVGFWSLLAVDLWVRLG